MIIRQNGTYIRTFLMVESADHVTGLTAASPVVKISKAGLSGGTAANSPATEVDSTNNPGLYKIILTNTDTDTLGDLAFHCTAASGDPTDFIDQVQSPVTTDLSLDANGNINVTSNIKKNQARPGFMFVMTDSTTHAPKTGLTVSGFRALDGGSFSATGNAPTELANGWYAINLLASDVNGNNVALRFTATGADDRNIFLMTQP